jgi:hypothetical protein
VARWRGAAADRTRAAHLIPGAYAGHEADEVQDVGQGDPVSDFGDVNARPGAGSQGRVIRGRGLSELRAWAQVVDREEPARLTGEPVGSLRVRRPPPADVIWFLAA